jgi:hypothetical protein
MPMSCATGATAAMDKKREVLSISLFEYLSQLTQAIGCKPL